MKKALTLFSLAVLTVGISTSTMAQTAGPKGSQGTLQAGAGQKAHRPGGNLKMMVQAQREILPKLNLTTDQQEQIKALNSKTESDLKEIRKNNKGNRDEIKDKVGALLKTYHESFTNILTPAQRKQWQEEFREFVKKWREEHKEAKKPNAKP